MEGGRKFMSQTIDKKVVAMDFENDKFEKGVATSLGTINKLKSSLDFSKVGDSLSGLSAAANGLNLSSLIGGLSAAQAGFLGLAALGIAQLSRLVSAAVDAGVRIAKALTIDPIKAGLQEYETKLNSVQTILANTQKEGTTLQIVTDALNELNEYSDKTIYNFQQMTRNVGTFTAAGVKLETSVAAIKGIANLAAISGSNAEQASTAMYQLSQALSTGTVKLMDWNSVVNAGMGGQVFQDAIKETARLHGVAIDQIIEEEGSFRDSLQKGWFTSEILTETLAKFTGDLNEDQLRTMGYTDEQIKSIIKMGQTASDAATKVKTFTQLFDTLKEAAQSGWAQTWELIIGDFEEAKLFLTELNDLFGGMIGASAESRNSLLAGWDELGGRKSLIESIRNLLSGVLSVVQPLGEAFKEIFPPVTAKQLFSLTEGLKEFTKSLKLTEDGASTVKRIFKGVFALLDIIVYAFSTVTKSVFGFSSTLKPTIGNLIEFIAKLADFIVNLRDTIRKSDGLGKVLNSIRSALESGGSSFKKFFDLVINGFKNFKNIDLSGLTTFIDNLKTEFKPLSTIVEIVKKVFNFFKLVLEKLAPIAVKLAEVVGKFVSEFIDRITESLGKFQPERVIDIINGGLLSGVLIAIKNFVSKGSGMFTGIADVLDSVKDSMKAWQNTLKADVLLKIAAALGIMALSILLLATIDKDKLGGALLAMTVMFTELGLSLAAFEKVSATTNPLQMSTMAVGLIAIAGAMFILSLAVSKLGSMDPKELTNGMLAIVSMIGIMALSSKTLSTSAPYMISGALALIVFSFAIKSLSESILTLGKVDGSELARGLIAVGTLLGELALFMKTTNIGAMGITSSLGILVLSGAIAILVKSVEALSKIDSDALFKALAAIGIILTELSVFIYATAGGSTLLLTAAGLAVISVAMIALTSVMERLSKLSWEQVGIGLTAMAGALALVGIASYLLPPNMIVQAAGLVVMAYALTVLADAMTSFGSMTVDQLAVSLLGLAGTLVILAVGLSAMTSTIGGSAALLVASVALLALAPAMKMLGSMSWEEIGRGLVGLAAAFVVLGLAGMVMTPVIPTLLSLGGAMILIGAGMALAGVGLLAFSAGLAALSVSGAAGVSALVIIISSIVGLVPMLVATVGRAILALVDVLVAGAPTLLSGIVTLLDILLDGLILVLPKLIDTVMIFVEKLLVSLAEKTPVFVQAGYDILIGLLEGVRANLGEVIMLSVDVANAYINGIASKLPEIVDSGWNLIIAWINSMSESVEANMPELITAVQGLGIAIVKGISQGIIDGRNNAFTAIRELGQMIIDEFKYILGIHSPSAVFMDIALNMILGLLGGLKSNESQVITFINDLANKVVESVRSKYSNMVNAGADLVIGLANGIRDYIGDVVSAATDLATSALTTIEDILDMHSPSKELAKLGMYADIGFANGIKRFSNVVLGSITDLGENAIVGFSNVVNRISDVIDSDMDITPTITPVIDMTDIERGSNDIKRLFGDDGFSPSVSVSKAKSISVDKAPHINSDGGSTNDSVKEITFIQHNNSPKALSPIEIYRQTNNQLRTIRGSRGGS